MKSRARFGQEKISPVSTDYRVHRLDVSIHRTENRHIQVHYYYFKSPKDGGLCPRAIA
jgi:hypothetical protein